jgi:hypothetical protein
VLTYFIYFVVVIIFIFVISLALKAIKRGLEAKDKIKDEPKNNLSKKKENIVSQLKNLKVLKDNGTIDEAEFEKAKKKLLG